MSDTHETAHIRAAVILNIVFTGIELAGGLWTNSLAILSDALHDFGDSVTLLAAWAAQHQAGREPDAKRTFGYRRVSLFSALFAALTLTAGGVVIISGAVSRLFAPEPVGTGGMMLLAVIGIAFNGVAALRLQRGQTVNERVLTWHILEDVFGWVAILIGAIVMTVGGDMRIDPILTIGYTAVTLWGVWKNLRETINILLQGVPSHISLTHLKDGVSAIPGVIGVHDVHVWSLDGDIDVFSGHIVVEDRLLKTPEEALRTVKDELTRHHIEHSTIELESTEFCSGGNCR